MGSAGLRTDLGCANVVLSVPDPLATGDGNIRNGEDVQPTGPQRAVNRGAGDFRPKGAWPDWIACYPEDHALTRLQELEIRASEIRERLNELSNRAEALPDEERAESETLRTEYRDVETKRRAAIEAEGATAQRDATEETTGEGAELERLSYRARISEYFRCATAGAALPPNSAERELQAAAEAPESGPNGGTVIPWRAMLLPERTGRHRADAATDTTALDGGVQQRPVLRRLFGRSVFGALGIRVDQVPAGRAEYVLLSGGAAAAQAAEGAAVDAAAATFASQTLKPKRLSARYLWSVEQSAQIGEGLEPAFRMDLGDALMAQMSRQAIAGTGVAPQITGILTRIPVPDPAPAAQAAFADFSALSTAVVDGIHAESERQTSVLLGVDSYKFAARILGGNSDRTGLAELRENSGMVQVSSYIPATSDKSQAAVLHASGIGEERGDSIAAMWGAGPELIRDPYGAAPEGRVALSALALWDCYMAFRLAAYARVSLRLLA